MNRTEDIVRMVVAATASVGSGILGAMSLTFDAVGATNARIALFLSAAGFFGVAVLWAWPVMEGVKP